jgi:PHD/YefM family antitoxin component YafN of YafNO toxin-antitoxin module
MVTKRGSEAAVLVAASEWQRLQSGARPTLKDLLLTDQGRGDLDLENRGKLQRRSSDTLE